MIAASQPTIVPVGHYEISVNYLPNPLVQVTEITGEDQVVKNIFTEEYPNGPKAKQKFPQVDFTQRKVVVVADFDSSREFDIILYHGTSLQDGLAKITCQMVKTRLEDVTFSHESRLYSALYLSVPKDLKYEIDLIRDKWNSALLEVESNEEVNKWDNLKGSKTCELRALQTLVRPLERAFPQALNQDVIKKKFEALETECKELTAKIQDFQVEVIRKRCGPNLMGS